MRTESINVAGRDGTNIDVKSADLDALKKNSDVAILLAGDPGWDDALVIWNGMAASIPAVVVQPTSASDVSKIIDFARDHGLLISVKGGGHNIAGTSLAPNGMTLEMSRMRTVDVDVDHKIAHVGPGCLLRDVDEATQKHGLATVLGFVSETGVAGLTLGGGFGYLTRRFGWSTDNLVEVEIVTADGKILVADRTEHAELFWALRGGGGNFGIVTRFTFALHDVGPAIVGGLMAWPADRAVEVMRTYRDVATAAPRELTMAATMRNAPPAPFMPEEMHGKPIVAVVVCHSGTTADADLAPLRALEPLVDVVMEKPYAAQQSMLDTGEPKGLHRYWKTEFFPELSDGLIDAWCAGGSTLPSPPSNAVLFHLSGAVNEFEDDDGAVGNRDAAFVGGFAGVWTPDADGRKAVVPWVRSSWEGLRAFSTGGNYVNFQLAEDDADRTADAYGKNFTRLQGVKAQYDPDNLFRVNRNISPAK